MTSIAPRLGACYFLFVTARAKALNESALLQAILEILGDDPRVLSVYLHGSAARDEMRLDSDLDLALLLKPKGGQLTALERQDMANRLAYRLCREVDLGEISSRNLVFAAEVLFKGKLLHTVDREADALCTTTLLGLYLQLNHDRAEVLDAYRA